MAKKYPTIGVSVPNKEYIKIADQLAKMENRSRSNYIVSLLEIAAKKAGLTIPKRGKENAPTN